MSDSKINRRKAWRDSATLTDASQHGLREDEYNSILAKLGRDLNLLEMGICSALYSEHCSYKSTKKHLRNLPTSGPRVLQGPGENAGIIDIGDGLAVAFKVESHNHPTFIEPFQGAATGVGGILRDVFTMGARPIAVMNALRFGEPTNERTPYLLSRSILGIGTYGNSVGIPTLGGELFFHKSYNGNCLINAFALGLVESDKIFRGFASGVGNSILYLGSKTGRDGIHGATMASESFDEGSEEKRPTVQVGDPFQEKLLLEACLELMKTGAVVGIQDMGAAGLTSSCYEMAERAGTGVKIHLDKVPQREEGMNPYELMLSESQERMLLVIEKGREAEVIDVISHWELDAIQIGEVTDGGKVELFWEGELVSDLPVEVVTSLVPEYDWPEAEPADFQERNKQIVDKIPEAKDLNSTWLTLLSSENLSSRRPVYNQYDSTVRSNTVVHPGGDAGLIRIKESAKNGGPQKGVALTIDCNSRYCGTNPKEGAKLSVIEAYRNISAVGALPVGISDCLNFGSPENPEGMWQIAEAIRGLGEAAGALDAPIVSGNVSLYNQTFDDPILPTPMVSMIGLIEDASKALPAHFQADGDLVFLIGETDPQQLGSSEYAAAISDIETGQLPQVNYQTEINYGNFIREAAEKSLLKSAHDVSSGGLAIAFSECCFSPYNSCGASLTLDNKEGRADGILFSESGPRYIISCSTTNEDDLKALAEKHSINISGSGAVGGQVVSIEGLAEISVKAGYAKWKEGLNSLLVR